ncbi:MAG TPA: sugar phosphate nucleotidyltransferase [Candidatus Cloacimonas sp.]|nr:NTP transferase domain-containing protein [Candidatus Cloacimonas sp.]MDD3868967.1 sugar phosphate nucleotidyltransferase [Candidatus Cloacimonadota bacterium]HNZ32910.1 sugar phosphate nucleotidyltransferase [Candidatus Cloacimonas sp.]HOG27394.1 sugar phosphate nucleotidyltransferase [Candidatus Cloacimonas sp.]HOQ77044.1 sugar phosphate nucleotidyltransferase [Candidatus Cloacimonas sp.]
MKGVIIAAGFGSRLWKTTKQIPKTLLPYKKGTILSTIIQQLQMAGISELIIVVGFKKDYIANYLQNDPPTLPVTLVENLEWERGNALSVYKAKDYINNEPFLLSMSDHLVKMEALKKIVEVPERINLLLTDPFISENFDVDDATKVLTEDDYIIAIGKELDNYNALDCGIFRLEPDFFTAVEKSVQKGNESISNAITELISLKRIKVVMLNKANQWMDIDTPEAYNFAHNFVI